MLLLVLSSGFILLSTKLTRKVRYLRSIEASIENKQTGALADAITNVLAVKSFAGGTHERRLFADITEKHAQATHNVMRAGLKQDSGITL